MVLGWRWPLMERHLAILLWGGWLGLTSGYFSFTTGLFHTYYLIMLGPAIAALVGVAFWAMQKVFRSRSDLGWPLVAGLTGVCLAFEIFVLRAQTSLAAAIPLVAGIAWLVGIVFLVFHRREEPRRAAWALIVVSLLVGPMVWSGLTTFNTNPEVNLPHAGPTTGGGQVAQDASTLTADEQAILDILLENAGTQKYLVGAGDSHIAAPYILATGLPVLTFGGFNGSDNVVDAAELAEMVRQGEIRFILGGGIQQNPGISAWLVENCTVVDVPGTGTPDQPANSMVNFGNMNANQLYDCG